VTRSQKKLANKICAISPFWADEPLGAIVMKVGLYSRPKMKSDSLSAKSRADIAFVSMFLMHW
jgi:hypothetical protein